MPSAPPLIPGELWDSLRAEPSRAPETLAVAAAERFAPGAAKWRASHPAASPSELAQAAKRRHVKWSRWEGAATGLGGVLAAAADIALLLWIQSRMVLHIAAAAGEDPYDRMRPAELLHMQGLYADPDDARAALDHTGRHLAMQFALRGRKAEEELLLRLLRMAGRRAASRLGPRAIPVVAVPINAVANERDTRKLANRAIRFYEVG